MFDTPEKTLIVALFFILGLVIGGFLFSGGGRKWKQRYNSEVDRRSELEKSHTQREKEWREQDSLRTAAVKQRDRDDVRDRDVVRDRDGDGVRDIDDRAPNDDRKL